MISLAVRITAALLRELADRLDRRPTIMVIQLPDVELDEGEDVLSGFWCERRTFCQ